MRQELFTCRLLPLLTALLLAALVQGIAGIAPIRSTGVLLKANNVQLSLSNSISWGSSALNVRGGSDEEDEDEEDEEEEKEFAAVLADQILDISKRGMVLASKAAVETYKALQRAIRAGFQGEDDQEVDEDEEPPTVVTKVLNTLKRMIKAAFTRPQEESEDEDAAAFKSTIKLSNKLKKKTIDESEDEEEEERASSSPTGVTKVLSSLKRRIKATVARPQEESEEESEDEDALAVKSAKTSKKLKKKTVEEDKEEEERAFSSSSPPADFGTYLSKAYGVTDERDESGPVILGGTLSDALKVARSQARLLVVLIPSAKPKKVKSDKEAIESVLSLLVAQAANRRARKRGEESGSFLFWGAKAESSDAKAAIKRLKTKATSSKGEKRPVVAVVYPAQVSKI
jgi:hypothetical protein